MKIYLSTGRSGGGGEMKRTGKTPAIYASLTEAAKLLVRAELKGFRRAR